MPVFAAHGKKHTFRNKGTEAGRLHVVAVPGGMDEFLEQMSRFSLGKPDIPKMVELAQSYGIALHPPAGAYVET